MTFLMTVNKWWPCFLPFAYIQMALISIGWQRVYVSNCNEFVCAHSGKCEKAASNNIAESHYGGVKAKMCAAQLK